MKLGGQRPAMLESIMETISLKKLLIDWRLRAKAGQDSIIKDSHYHRKIKNLIGRMSYTDSVPYIQLEQEQAINHIHPLMKFKPDVLQGDVLGPLPFVIQSYCLWLFKQGNL